MNYHTRFSRADFSPGSLVELLMWRALHKAEDTAFIFLVDGEKNEARITYGELDRRARAIAALLQSFVAPGDRALLLFPPGLDYISTFFGCLYAGVIAVPAYPPDPTRLDRTLPRLQALLADAQASLVLTTTPILTLAELLFTQAPDLGTLQWMATDNLQSGQEYAWQEPILSKDSLAFLQYTSGSTRLPRGVMVTHGNLLFNSELISQAFEVGSRETGVIWLPPYHDMGLIGGIIQPIYIGFPCVLLSPLDFLQRPIRWLQAVSKYQGTISGGPNFAYDLCARKVTPEQLAQLDLSSWTLAFSGAEPVRAETIQCFSETFAPCGFRREAFYPCYGLAEATLIVSGGRRAESPRIYSVKKSSLEQHKVVRTIKGDPDGYTIVGCGQNLAGQEIAILDMETRTICPPGEIGEIWVTGPSVASGYWNRPEESQETFRAQIDRGMRKFYLRTGDLGVFIDSELLIAGRIKDMIIVDGLNHYPQDIEKSVEESHPDIRPGCSAAFSIDINGKEQLITVAEVNYRASGNGRSSADGQENNLETIRREIRKVISTRHDLRVHDIVLIKPRTIPKTSSGKIQRSACRSEYLAGTLDVIRE